ncbi:MAG: Crp/Fnr family transcriptional regulator [Bacteroidales bacterium]|nr:Crp/Fnr family transcriptional regulator [Bacteroidales bacterium]
MLNFTNNLQCEVCIHRQQCFFSSLSREEYDFLNRNKKEVDFRKGETIYKQGTQSNYLVFLLSGMAKVLVEGANNKNFILQLVKPFHFLDFPALFEDKMLYRTTVAVVDSRACLIDLEAFKSMILSNKKHVPLLIKHFNRAQQHYTMRMINVLYKNMEARIADALLYLVNEVYYSRVFTLTISRKDLAELAGMSKESTSRILSQLKEQEVLRIKGKEIEVVNKKYLEQLSRIG